MKIKRLARVLAASLILSAFVISASAQENFGSIVGTVSDSSGSSVPNAAINLSGDRLPHGKTINSDSSGGFNIPNLPVGNYTVTVTAPGFSTYKAVDFQVTLGAATSLSPRLAVGQLSEVIEVNDIAETLNITSSATETTVNSDEIDRLAKGRRFESLLALAPGVRREVKGGSAGVGGISVNGASGLENTYFLDGVEVSDVLNGGLRSANAIPTEFITQLQIQSGGYAAEYGGATGGVINVAIKNGSNNYHGEVFGMYTGDNINAGDRGYWQRSPLNANAADFFKPKEDSYSLWYPGGNVGGRIIRDKLFFFAGYSPEVEHTDRTINYASGARTYQQDWLRHYAVGRLDYSLSSRVQLYGSWLWSPQKRNGALPSRDARIAAPKNSQSIQGGFTPAQAVNAGGTILITPKFTVSVRYGYKYLNAKDGNYGISGDPYVQYLTASDAAGLPVPTPGGNGFSNVSSTLLTDHDITTRHNLYVDSGYILNWHGEHNFKVGYDLNYVGNDVVSDYSNGSFQIYWGDAFNRGSITDQKGTYGYYIWQDGVRLNSKVNGRNQGVYFQDSWRVTPRFTINAGLRLENEYLPPYRKEQDGIKIANPVDFGWGSKLAPRIGAAWDVVGDGKWKISGSFGLFYDTLKYNLARGSFGGEFWESNVYTLDNPNVLSLSKANPGALGTKLISYDNRTVPINAQGELDGIDPHLKPYASRSFNLSLDHQFTTKLFGTVRYTRSDLLRTIEDIGVLDSEDNEVYLIGNPGFGDTRNTASVYGQKTPNGQSFLVPKAVRSYNAVEFRLKGEIGHFLLIPSYTWSRLYGNYSGLGNSDEAGRSNPNNNRSFDLPYYYFDESGKQKNVQGLLGTDRPHVFSLWGAYDLKTKIGTTNFGLSQVAESGTNDSTSVIYLSAPTYPFGRGDIARTPVYTQTDFYVSHQIGITERLKAVFDIEVRNLFNQAAVIARVSQLNRAGAISQAQLPLSQFFGGYDVTKFVYPGSTTVPYNPIYGRAGASNSAGGGPGSTLSSAYAAANPNFGGYQDFRTLRLGIHLKF